MNLPAGTAIPGGRMAAVQLQRITGIGEELMRFADDAAADADPPRQDPLLGTAFRRVGMFSQQPIQQRAHLRYIRQRMHPARMRLPSPNIKRKVRSLRFLRTTKFFPALKT